MAEKVIGLLEKLNLSATERKSIRLYGGAVIGSQQGDPQAVGKVMVEKTCERNPWNFPLARSGVLFGAWSAKIWGKLIPLHFPARAGEKEALEDGLWMFGKDLVVMAEFDGAKTIDEIEFNSILIWVSAENALGVDEQDGWGTDW